MIEPRSIEGRWVAGASEATKYGVLEFDPETGLKLQTKILSQRTHEEVLSAKDFGFEKPGDIHGYDLHNRPVTLFFCSNVKANRTTALETRNYHSPYGVLGRHFDSWDAFRFQGAILHLTDLHEWLGRAAFEKQETTGQCATFDLQYEESAAYDIGGNATLRFASAARSSQSGSDKTTHELTREHLVEFNWRGGVQFREAQDSIAKLKRLLALATGRPCYLRSFKIYLDREAIPPEETEVLFSQSGISEVISSDRHTAFLFTYNDVKDRIQDFLVRWMKYCDEIEPVLRLYSSVVFNKHLYLNHQFLFLAQALESYHALRMGGFREDADDFRLRLGRARKALTEEDYRFFEDKLNWGNSKTFLQRLCEIEKARETVVADVVGQYPDFARVVKDTRNYYTHHADSLVKKGRVADDGSLLKLTRIMQTTLEILFFDDLGVGGNAVVRAKERLRNLQIVEYK